MARIVYIDDEEALREIVAEILSAVGHEIVLAGTGLEGVEAVRRERPDLVLCDVNMPGLDGYGVLRTIRQDPRLSSIPFLFLTSLDTQGHVRAGMVSGADDYLAKPIRAEELVCAIDARLERRKASQLEADRLVDEMRRSVAMLLPHELRTPLTTILGSSHLIRQLYREMSREEIGEMADSMFRAAQRLNRMAENYMLYAELDLQRLASPGTLPHQLVGSSGADDVRQVARGTAAEWGRDDDLRLELEDARVPVAAPYLRKLAAELVDAFIAPMQEAGEMPGAVTVVARRGKLVHFAAHGLADMESRRSIRTDDILAIASMTKPIATVGVLMLLEEQRFLLSDPIERYLPEFREMKVAVEKTDAPGGYVLAPVERSITGRLRLLLERRRSARRAAPTPWARGSMRHVRRARPPSEWRTTGSVL